VTSAPETPRRSSLPASFHADSSPAPLGRILSIHIAPAAGRPMQAVPTVEARTGGGLVGDRYDSRTGHWSPIARRGDWLSMVEQEEIDRLARDWGLSLAPGETRRNLTTRGIRLASLLGRRFRIGAVTCFAVRPCEPCTYLEQLLGRDIIYPLVHRSGIRVEVLEGGTIAEGDPIEPLDVYPRHVASHAPRVAAGQTEGPEGTAGP
jgi:MOSC domain-containing protein YiiM